MFKVTWKNYISDEERKKLGKDDNCRYAGPSSVIPELIKNDVGEKKDDYVIVMFDNPENYRVIDSCDNCKHIYRERAEVGSIEIIYYSCMLYAVDVDDSTPLDHGPVGKCDGHEATK